MCTTFIVGNKASVDGSFIMSRSADSSALKAQLFIIHPAKDYAAGEMYRTQDHKGATDFTYPQPAHAMRYTSVPNWQTKLHGAVGFNEAGLAVTGTESIFARDDALVIDPYNKVSGITEDDIIDIILPRAKTAKDGVLLLGSIIEEHGAGEGFGVGFCDSNEVWYLETGTGHQWMAQRIPADVYFGSGNQGRLRFYDPQAADQLGSPTLIEFAEKHGFYDPKKGPFDFAAAYTRNDERDRIYNDPRVWEIQKLFNPSLIQPVDDGREFAVFMKPEHLLSVEDAKRVMRDHFDGSEHDPYSNGLNGEEPWRPISVFRTYEAHVVQVRPWMPAAVGNIIYLAFGMADLSCFMPFYQGLESVPEHYAIGTDQADSKSVYWKFRKLQTLVMTNYSLYAPIVKEAFAEQEKAMSVKQAEMEKKYLELVKKDEKAATELLQKVNLELLAETEALAESLTNRIFTLATENIQKGIFFANRSKKD